MRTGRALFAAVLGGRRLELVVLGERLGKEVRAGSVVFRHEEKGVRMGWVQSRFDGFSAWV